MAVIKCPICGKQITDRMEKCPHCNAVLIEKKHEEPITKEVIKSSAKDSILGVVVALVLTLVVEKVWSIIACIQAEKFMGMVAAEAVSYAERAFYSKNFAVLIVGAVLFCVLSILFKQKSATQFIGGIILTVLFCVIGFVMQSSAIMNSNVPADGLDWARSLSFGFGFAFPMVLGSLSISSYERTLKKSLLMQALLGVVFIVASVLIGILMLVVFGMGTGGLALGNLAAAIIILILAVLTNKGFQQVITSNKIS
ncbi:MAG: zinc ribbon domain-containing protein [Clostridia bacterium]|nr:zinc ribbon domain-containing protein [Clostridia bacterium]